MGLSFLILRAKNTSFILVFLNQTRLRCKKKRIVFDLHQDFVFLQYASMSAFNVKAHCIYSSKE